MTATLFLAVLSHPRRYGRAVGDPEAPPVLGAPIHLSIHTTDQGAVDALREAMIAEWEEEFRHSCGPAESWIVSGAWAGLSRTMVEHGYLAAAIERPVAFAGEPVL